MNPQRVEEWDCVDDMCRAGDMILALFLKGRAVLTGGVEHEDAIHANETRT